MSRPHPHPHPHRPDDRLAPTAWRWFLAVGLAAAGMHALLGGGGAQPAIYQVVAGVATITVVLGVRLHEPAGARSWNVLAAGIALWVVGDLIWNAHASVFDTQPFPAPADVAYLASYPLLIVAVVGLVRARHAGREVGTLVDALAVCVAAVVPTWIFLVSPAAADSELGVLGRIVAIAYPVADLFLVLVLARLVLSRGPRPRAFWLLLGGLSVNLLADAVYAVPSVNAHYAADNPLETLYLLGYVLLGAAALDPSMVDVATPGPDASRAAAIRWRVVLMGLAAATAPALVAVQSLKGRPEHVPLLLGSWLVVLSLVLIRLVRTMRELAAASQFDPLTRLANRSLLMTRVESLLERRAGRTDDVALLSLDLDRFRAVNDAIGHAAGDVLLVEVAERLRGAVRPSDLVARLGGDEFVVLCEDVADEQAARAVAERLSASLADPFWVDGSPHFLSASIGISRATSVAARADSLLQDADAALSRAKVRGAARSELFDHELAQEMSLRGRFEHDLHRAVDQDQLLLHYQPVIDLRSGGVSGVEALLRWQHPDWGLTKPDSILPIAEESGVVVAIGRWVVAEACQQLRQWRREKGTAAPGEVTVNVSRRELVDKGYVAHLEHCLRRADIEAQALVLEVSDDDLADAPASMLDTLLRARALGVHVCIDGFGRGRRSLANLRRVPVTRIKLDRDFVRTVADDTGDRLVVTAVLQLGASLGLDVIAAGVETRSQRTQLERMGCTHAQGNLWAPPLPPGSVLDAVLGRVND
jgi:diguanylate cyclase (GGDEF)-like protein